MTSVVVCILFTNVFLFAFLKQLYDAICLVVKKEVIENNFIFKAPKNPFQIVKKRKVLLRKKVSSKLFSQKIYAKFLFQKEFDNMLIETKILINKIYHKLASNVIQFNSKVDFEKLLNCGINSCVFLVKKPKEERKLSNLLLALDVLKQRVEFCPIFIENNGENVLPNRSILLQDVNLKLFQQICKVNLNYNPEFNKTFEKTDLDFKSKSPVDIVRIASESGCISYVLNSELSSTVSIYIKLKTFLFNLEKTENKFKIKYFNNEEIIYSTNTKFIDVFPINNNFIPYLCVKLRVLKNARTLLVSGEDSISFKSLLLQEKMFFNNKFNLKIYTSNQKFNDFFNHFLVDKIKEEIYQKNYLIKSKFNYDKQFLSKFLNVDYCRIAKIQSPNLLKETIVGSFLGIEIRGDQLFVLKPSKFNYKIVLNFDGKIKNIFVKNGEIKQVIIGETCFLNCGSINLKSLSKPATLCV